VLAEILEERVVPQPGRVNRREIKRQVSKWPKKKGRPGGTARIQQSVRVLK